MQSRPLQCLAGLSLIWACGGNARAQDEESVRAKMRTWPITIVVLDDVGHEFLAAAHTPVIDSLASEGAWFRQAWAYPMCSSARAALLTGRYGFRTGVGGLIPPQSPELGLSTAEVTLAELLPERVEMFGKWHLGLGPDAPNVQGFDHYAGCRYNLGNSGGGKGYYDYPKTVDGVVTDHSIYATTDTTEDALLSTAGIRIVAYHAAHSPFEKPPGGRGKSIQEIAIEMLEHLDRELGRLLADYRGYLFLLSDNGSMKVLGGDKFNLTEGGIRVPFLVHGPGIEPAVYDDLVSIVDVMATVAEMRGAPCSAEDSVSLLPILFGQAGKREIVYSEKFTPPLGDSDDHHRAVRGRDVKVTIDPGGAYEVWSMPDEVLVPPPYDPAVAARVRRLLERMPR